MNNPIATKIILEIIEKFYQVAIDDILIGFHFRHIKDFSTHIPHIVDFWETQLYAKPRKQNAKNFQFIEVHIPLKITKGQTHRWLFLFKENLTQYLEKKLITSEQHQHWLQKIDTISKGFLENKKLFGS